MVERNRPDMPRGGVDFEKHNAVYAPVEKGEKPGGPLRQYGEEIGMFSIGFKGQFEHHSMLQISAIEVMVRKQAFEKVMDMRKETPRRDQAYLLATGWHLGGRGGACIEGDHVLTLQESYDGKEFDNAMFRILFRRMRAPGPNKKGFEVPYRIMLPKGPEGMLVAARGASYIRREPGCAWPRTMKAAGKTCSLCLYVEAQLSLGFSRNQPQPNTYGQRGTNVLQSIFKEHFQHFAEDYEQKYAPTYGRFRLDRITEVVENFLCCGDYSQGVARIQCTNPVRLLEQWFESTL